MIETKNRVMYRLVRSDVQAKPVEKLLEVRDVLQNAVGDTQQNSLTYISINVGLAKTLVEIIDQAIDAEGRLT